MAVTLPMKVVFGAIDNLTGPLRRIGSGFTNFGAKAGAIGRKMSIGLTAPLALVATSAISTGLDFEKSMNRVEALTGTTGDALDNLRGKARDLGKDTAFSASEAAESMTFLGQAGFDMGEIMSAIGPTLDLAAAGNVELAETADIISDAIRGFGKEASDAGMFADVYAAAITNATTDLVTFQEGMKLVAPVAAGMNNSLVETSTLMAAVSDAGLKGTIGGTALKQAFVALMKPSREAKQALFDLEIPRSHILDSEGRVKSLMTTLNELSDAGATPGQILDIFGKRALPAILALTDRGSAGLKELQAELEKSGKAAEIAQIQMQGAPGEVARLRAAFDELKLSILDSGLLKAFTGLVVNVKDLVLKVADANPLVLKIGLVLGAVAAVVGPLLILIGAMSTGLGVVAGVITGALIPAATKLFAILMANPIFLVIAAIVAMTVAAVDLMGGWEKVGEFFKSLWGGIVSVFKDAVNLILEGLDWLFSFVPDFIKEELGLGAFEFQSLQFDTTAPNIGAADVIEARTTEVTRAESTLKLEVEGKEGAGVQVVEERGDLPVTIDLGGTLRTAG
jgi:TP901 family phage tail tape measure protein